MASVVRALRAVSVPVVVVADFDILKNGIDVENLMALLGGNFDDIATDLRVVASALESDTKPLRKTPLRDVLMRQIDELPDEIIGKREAEAVRSTIHAETGWDKAKRSGTKAVPQGAASDACERVVGALREIGIMVVPVGQLERFAPGVSGHGPSWATEVLSQGLHETPGRDAAEFVEALRVAASEGRRRVAALLT